VLPLPLLPPPLLELARLPLAACMWRAGRVVYETIPNFAWDQDSTNVEVLVRTGLDGVGELPKAAVTCSFTSCGFDLKVHGLGGKNYRVVQEPLEHEINAAASSFRVKKNSVQVLLRKAQSYDHFNKLVSNKKPAEKKRELEANPSSAIMDIMKNLYEEGDDTMRATIGKAMEESRMKQAMGAMS
jgi:calcyclin binding protein